MHKTFLKRRADAGDDATSSGGPGGATARGPDLAPLTLDEARAIEDLYLRGGAGRFIGLFNTRLHTAAKMNRDGLIETQEDARGKTLVKLTPRGLQRLLEATGMVKANKAPSP